MAQISSGKGHISNPIVNRGTDVIIEHIPEEDLIGSIQSSLTLNGGVGIYGVIANTVNRASELAQQLAYVFGEDKVLVAHSRFLSIDRLIKDAEVLEVAGKNSKRDTLQIVVGTQVLEQSLDIDFDALYSDLAPVASIIQRMGRLHRHSRPERKHQPVFTLLQEPLTPQSVTFAASRRIYGEWLIDVAEEYFEEKTMIAIPADIQDAIEWLPEGHLENPIYLNFTKKNENIREDQTRDFTLSQPTSKKRKSLHGAFSLSSAEGKTSNLIEAKVRNIDLPSLEVIVLFEGENGGLWVPQYDNGEKVELYISDNGELTWSEEKSILSSTLRLPHYCANLDFVEFLEKLVDSQYGNLREQWKQSKILRNELFMVFPQDGNLKIADISMKYNPKIGLETTHV